MPPRGNFTSSKHIERYREISFELDRRCLFAVAVLAETYLHTLAGGGGLITIPGVMLSGMFADQCAGHNKLQAALGTGHRPPAAIEKNPKIRPAQYSSAGDRRFFGLGAGYGACIS